MEKYDKLIAEALALGAYKANVITTDKIELDRVFRDICASNGCGVYGKCYMCPPDVGDIDALMAEVREYDYALVYQTVSELEDSLPDTAGQPSDQGEISAVIDSFLRELEPRERAVFIRRYFYADSVADIAKAAGLSYRAVTSMLHRTRKKLRARLQKEGIIV